MAVAAVNQGALDEVVVEDPGLEARLESREAKRAAKSEATREFKAADDLAKAELEAHELPEGGALRVGRFRVERKVTKGRSVSFETQPGSRLAISTVDEDEG